MSCARGITKYLRIPTHLLQWSIAPLSHTVMASTHSSSSNDRCLKKSLSEWQFSHSTVMEANLPIDPMLENVVRSNIPRVVYSRVQPTPLTKDVRLASFSHDVLVNILDMDPSISESEEFVDWVAGKLVLPSSVPLAHRYGGYQFGMWASQLGDGRAISLGEYVSRSGQRWEVQLKGSGLTPYSRTADGRAVLRSSVREFLCSEAMHALGIPTSRAAALVCSDDPIVRDQFYDGNPRVERGAIVMRIAPSWLRFGSLEILTMNREIDVLQTLVEHVIKLRGDIDADDDDRYVQLFEKVRNETINLVVDWTRVGFTHGVLNTDNMSLFGVTIDYGPFGFMEAYDPEFIPNTSDNFGRYCFSNQLKIIPWNLQRLAEAIGPLLASEQIEKVKELLRQCPDILTEKLNSAFERKLGLNGPFKEETRLYSTLMGMMKDASCDFTMTFRQLGYVDLNEILSQDVRARHWALQRLGGHSHFPTFVSQYRQRMEEEGLSDAERRENILTRNPQYVLRNWMAQQAIQKADKNDFSEVNFLLEVLNNPFTVNPEAEKRGYSGPTPSWACKIHVSCSS